MPGLISASSVLLDDDACIGRTPRSTSSSSSSTCFAEAEPPEKPQKGDPKLIEKAKEELEKEYPDAVHRKDFVQKKHKDLNAKPEIKDGKMIYTTLRSVV